MEYLNQIPERDKTKHDILVFGFIREFEAWDKEFIREFEPQNETEIQIPLDVKLTVDKFYFIPDNAVKDFLSDAVNRYHQSEKTKQCADDFIAIWTKMGLMDMDDLLLKDFKRIADEYLDTFDTDTTISYDEFIKYFENHRPPNEILSTFEEFDRDGDGVLNFQDIKQTMLSLGESVSDQEITNMINEIDLNGDGVIDYQEFKQTLWKVRR